MSTLSLKNNNGSGCGSVGRAVASNTRGRRFESSHRQKFIFTLNICLLSTVYSKDKNKGKEAGYGPFFKNIIREIQAELQKRQDLLLTHSKATLTAVSSNYGQIEECKLLFRRNEKKFAVCLFKCSSMIITIKTNWNCLLHATKKVRSQCDQIGRNLPLCPTFKSLWLFWGGLTFLPKCSTYIRTIFILLLSKFLLLNLPTIEHILLPSGHTALRWHWAGRRLGIIDVTIRCLQWDEDIFGW